MSDETPGWFQRHHKSTHERLDDIKRDLADLKQEIRTMSGNLENDLTAQTAAVQALATEVSNGLTANAAAIAALQQQIANGGTVSAADLSTLENNTAAIIAATGSLTAALNPAPAGG